MNDAAYTYLNGSMVPAAQALVPISDRGFLYGDGLFETVPVYAGRPFLLRHHSQRLVDGARALRFATAPSLSVLEDAALQVIQSNRAGDGVLRLALSRGAVGAEGLACATAQPPTLAVTWSAPRRYSSAAYLQGIDVRYAQTRHPAPDGVPTTCKHANYLACILALDEARSSGAAEALMLGPCGTVVEAATSNLFVVHRGRLVTPPLSVGALAGITRGAVLAMAPSLGLEVAETEVSPHLLSTCSEVFLTNSLAGVLPVRHVHGDAVRQVGAVTRQLFLAYWRQVRELAGPPWPDVIQAEGEFHAQPCR